MKKFLTVLLIAVTLFACTTENHKVETTMPTEIGKMRENHSFDTLLVIQTDKKLYVFDNKTNEYKYTMEKESDSTAAFLGGLFLCFIILLLIVLIAA
jgi:hypothetical protein